MRSLKGIVPKIKRVTSVSNITNMQCFDFEHINLVPRKCIVESRKECDTSVQIGKYKFRVPVIPANMECVINEEIAEKLAKNGYFYIMHRFDIDVVEFIRSMKQKNLYSSISIGVNDDAYELLNIFRKEDLIPEFITIDIAHGHAIKMETMLTWIRSIPEFNNVFVIAGNVGTPDAVRDLEAWGANAIKIGIGNGSACTTYHSTGFGTRGIQLSSVHECSKATFKPETLIIADGGIKEAGDIAKCMVLGANLTMVGGMFSGMKDSPGNTVTLDGKSYKEYWGSASAFQSGKSNRIEGTKKLLPLNDKTILEQMVYIEECLQSAISYGGCKKIIDMTNVDYIIKK
jgi:GMP reductase